MHYLSKWLCYALTYSICYLSISLHHNMQCLGNVIMTIYSTNYNIKTIKCFYSLYSASGCKFFDNCITLPYKFLYLTFIVFGIFFFFFFSFFDFFDLFCRFSFLSLRLEILRTRLLLLPLSSFLPLLPLQLPPLSSLLLGIFNFIGGEIVSAFEPC